MKVVNDIIIFYLYKRYFTLVLFPDPNNNPSADHLQYLPRDTALFQVLSTSGCKSENRAIQSNCRRI